MRQYDIRGFMALSVWAILLTGWPGSVQQALAQEKNPAPASAAANLPAVEIAARYRLKPGPHLFLDNHLVAESSDVKRVVVQPERSLKAPVVTSAKEHDNWQPWLTVLHDPNAPADKRFRMWYNAPADAELAWLSKVAYLESADGIAWPGPFKHLDVTDTVLFGDCVLDDRAPNVPPQERFKILFFGFGTPIGPRVAFSADGLKWERRRGEDDPILKVAQGNDSWHTGYDPIRGRYFLICKELREHTWTNAEGKKLTQSIRLYAISFSKDFKKWTPPKLILAPDEKDPGITQWYGVVGFQVRGDLIVAFLQVLRDDLTTEGAPKEAIAANGGRAAGMGYTVLAWTRDGETWQRDRHTDPFLQPDPKVGSWDHAMAWVSSAVPVGEEVFLYYGGYRWGHKYLKGDDRQVGLVKIKRDRYVARRAGDAAGKVRTPVVSLDGGKMTLNADASAGEIRVQICDAKGMPLPGYTFADCTPIKGDSLNAAVQWKGSLASIKGQPVRLEFSIRNASLFAFDLIKE